MADCTSSSIFCHIRSLWTYFEHYHLWLVGGFKHFLFSIIYGILLPIDSYFSRWLKPPTRWPLMRIGHDSKWLTHVDTKKLDWFVLSGTKNDLKLDISQPQKDRNMGCRKISEHVISSHTANMLRHFLVGFSSTKSPGVFQLLGRGYENSQGWDCPQGYGCGPATTSFTQCPFRRSVIF